jgi:hypothetical protein
MRKVIAFFAGCCCLCVFSTACSNLGNNTVKNDAVVSIDLPAVLFASETTTAGTEYTVTAKLSDADSGAVIETLLKTPVTTGESVMLTFSPVAVGRAVILSISVTDNGSNTLYMSGKSARYIVVEGEQALNITLTKTGGGETTGTGIISGTVKYADGETSSEGIVVFIEKNETAAASAAFSVQQKNISTLSVRSAAASTSTTSNYVINNAVAIAQTAGDGNFEFTELAAGSYTVYAVSSNIILDRAAYSTITITDGASETVSLELTATGSITGMVQLNGNATGNGGIFVYVQGTSFIALTDDEGKFTISNVPVSSTEYALDVSYKGKVRTFAAGSDSVTTVLVTAGSTASAGTMNFAIIKQYLTDSSGTVSTKNYVQAVETGLQFGLTDMPDNAAAVVFGFEGYTDASGTYHNEGAYLNVDKIDYSKGVTEQDDITNILHTYHLVVPDVTYKNVFVFIYNSEWTKLASYSVSEVAAVGGYGTIGVSNASDIALSWNPDTFTLSTSGTPELNFDLYGGRDIAFCYCEFQITASDGTIAIISEKSYKDMSIVFGDILSAAMLEKICGSTDVKMSVTYKIKLKEDAGDIRPDSSGYSIYSITLSNQTVNAFSPTVAMESNGGTFTPVSAGTAVSTILLSKDSSGNAFTPETTFADVQTALASAYTLSYVSGGITALDNPYCTDSRGNTFSVSNTTLSLGYSNYKVVFYWTLPLTSANYGTGWSGTYATKDSANKISLSSTLIATYVTGSPAVLTVTATGTPSVYYELNGTSYQVPCDSSSGSTYIYSASSSYDIYITGSDVTISSVTLTSV